MAIERIFKILDETIKHSRDVALATVILSEGSTPRDSGSKMLVFDDGSIEGSVGGGKLEALCIEQALEAIKTGKNKKAVFDLTAEGIGMECSGRNEVFIEVFAGGIKILILGAGHVNSKIGEMSSAAGIMYSVADERSDFASRERFPHAENIYVETPDTVLSNGNVCEKTYIVIATRGHALDESCLEMALKTEAAYIGMIGSKSMVPTVFKNLNAKGLHPENDPRVYSPVGLDIGGKTPGDIAVSVIAEILKVKNMRSGRHLRIKNRNK